MTTTGSPDTGADLPRGDDPTPHDGAGATDADRIQSAVLDCAAVAGVAVTAASFLPGRDVAGVELTDDTVEVHVIAAWGQPIADIGDQIGTAVEGLLSGRALHVFVDDILLPGQNPPPTPAELATAARERVAEIGRRTADAAQAGAAKVRDAARTAGDKAQNAAAAASDVAADAKDTASDVAQDAKDAASDVAQDAKDTASDVAQDAKDPLDSTAPRARHHRDDPPATTSSR